MVVRVGLSFFLVFFLAFKFIVNIFKPDSSVAYQDHKILNTKQNKMIVFMIASP